MTQNQDKAPQRPGRGFAGMDPQRRQDIAREGGRAAHRSGNAHQFTSEEARAAGRKGGRAVSEDRRHMAEIGRRGGVAAGRGGTPQDEASLKPEGGE
ncbi:general stress protein YciG [Deinococcus sp. HSC-46F16]|uniref:KGG domain-containing protein n=1 Tax=Deinococcus sp. HSC-46F16 TaxID=2910968 RepID=UPI0020A1F757|nr:KGG domain-containing protein [Deinococcus sp. HSC-46F16]MCP2014501.1 general stress protein YciG [Deinococcus sp. HSC-46F16]